jgi:hypothetical protein
MSSSLSRWVFDRLALGMQFYLRLVFCYLKFLSGLMVIHLNCGRIVPA